MRGKRKTREQALQDILSMMNDHKGTRFKPSFLATTLQLGRERTGALLRTLEADGKVAYDGQGWFVSLVNPEEIHENNGETKIQTNTAVQTWIAIGHIGKRTRVIVEFEP